MFDTKSNSQSHSLEREKLNASARQRGVYLNESSRDAGPDPDWDLATNTWKGRRAKILHPSVYEEKADLVKDIMHIEANDILKLRDYNDRLETEQNARR